MLLDFLMKREGACVINPAMQTFSDWICHLVDLLLRGAWSNM